MVGLAEIAKRGGKIARADEHAIDALNARNAFEVLEPALRLHLQQKTDLGVAASAYPLIRPKREARVCAANAAEALRRVANGHDRATGFLLRFHIGDQQRLGADVEQALDDHRVVPGRADHGMRRSAAGRQKLGMHHRQFVRRVLGVEQNPVESGIREDFDREMARQAVPQPDLQPAGLQRLLEGVMKPVHWGEPKRFEEWERAPLVDREPARLQAEMARAGSLDSTCARIPRKQMKINANKREQNLLSFTSAYFSESDFPMGYGQKNKKIPPLLGSRVGLCSKRLKRTHFSRFPSAQH